MAINFTRLFTALGKVCGALNEWNTSRGSTLTTRVSTLRTQFTGIDADLDDDLTTNQNNAVTSGDVWVSYLTQMCQRLVIDEVLNDRPQTDQQFTACLTELVRQMGVAAESLATSLATVGSVTAVGAPTGTPTWVVSDLDALRQARSDWTLPDVLLLTAVGNTSVNVQGQAAVTPETRPTWPTGAGVNTTLTQINAATTSLGADPGFESWLAGPPISPVSWTILSGTAGTTVSQASDTPVTGQGTYSLQLLGDGTTLKVRQQVTVSAGECYFLHAFVKRTANPANTGTLTVSLRDSAGTLLSGTSNISILTSAASGSWTANTAALVTPKNLPTDGLVYLEIQYNGGVGDTLRLDQVALNLLPTLYTGGLRLAVVKGVTATVTGDAWTHTTTLASPTAAFIRALNRLLALTNYSVRIPTSGAPTQANALVS